MFTFELQICILFATVPSVLIKFKSTLNSIRNGAHPLLAQLTPCKIRINLVSTPQLCKQDNKPSVLNAFCLRSKLFYLPV